MPYFSINCPARFCEESNTFATFDVIVDIESDRVELVSEDKKNVIRLDLVCADELKETLQGVIGSKPFQDALKEKIVEHRGRYSAMNAAVL